MVTTSEWWLVIGVMDVMSDVPRLPFLQRRLQLQLREIDTPVSTWRNIGSRRRQRYDRPGELTRGLRWNMAYGPVMLPGNRGEQRGINGPPSEIFVRPIPVPVGDSAGALAAVLPKSNDGVRTNVP